MIALLPNSGRGTRMGDATREHPKCMTPLDEKDTIISWQVRLLEDTGIREAVVTTGPFAGLLEAYLTSLRSRIRFHFVPNPRYGETNYIYSMHLARELLHDDVVSLHGDLVLTREVMEALVAAPRSVVAVDSSLPLPEKDFKAEIRQGRVQAIGVDRFGPGCVASQPAYKFLRRDMDAWMAEIARFIERGEERCYAENAFNAIWEQLPLYPLELAGRLCREIDTPEDAREVRELFRRQCRPGQ